MDAARPATPDISEYFGFLRRDWWLLLLMVTVGLGAGEAVTRAQPKVYESATSVLVQPVGRDTNVVGGRTRGDINLDTEAQLVRSTAVAAGAAELLRSPAAPAELAGDVRVEVPANTAVLVITYRAGQPEAARAGSHAFAEAYLRNREAGARAELDAQAAALNEKIKQLSATLTQVNGKLAALLPGSPQRAGLESQRSTTQSQLNSLTSRLNELSTATVNGGEIISPARLPTAPTKPNRMVNLAGGLTVGLLLALAGSAARERLSRRVRAASDVERRAGVPVLTRLTAQTTPHDDQPLPPAGPTSRLFHRLRNEVLASLDPDDRVIVVTGADPGRGSRLVAAGLATALARGGTDVVLVCAQPAESLRHPVAFDRFFGVAPTPGLGDVLAGTAGLAAAVQRAPREPRLSVVATGGAASAAGLLQPQRLRDVFRLLRDTGAYVVVAAPSTASGADAQSLASLADAAIVTVELRRALRSEVDDAAAQLRRVGTPLLGAVVLPRLGPAPRPEPPAGAAAPHLPPPVDAAAPHLPPPADEAAPHLPPPTEDARSHANVAGRPAGEPAEEIGPGDDGDPAASAAAATQLLPIIRADAPLPNGAQRSDAPLPNGAPRSGSPASARPEELDLAAATRVLRAREPNADGARR